MSPETEIALNLVSQATGLISILSLFWASLGVPHDKESWKGSTAFEIMHRKRRRVLKWIGIPCAVIAVGCQTVITLWSAG